MQVQLASVGCPVWPGPGWVDGARKGGNLNDIPEPPIRRVSNRKSLGGGPVMPNLRQKGPMLLS
jgi:hypothetical protein